VKTHCIQLFQQRVSLIPDCPGAQRAQNRVYAQGFAPGNIIVKVDGTVVLLDWGLAGFWLEYWEFFRAMFSPGWRASWDRMVGRSILPYYVEYSVNKRVFGTVWN